MKRKLSVFALVLILSLACALSLGTAAFAESGAKSVSLYSCPDKTVYVAGDALEPAGAKLLVDGKVIDVTETMLGNVSMAEVGVKRVEVIYAGAKVSFEIEVVENYVVELTIKTKPSKLAFAAGEDFGAEGGVLSAVWFDGAKSEVSMTDGKVSFTGFRKEITGRQLITVSYAGGVTSYFVQVEGENGDEPTPPPENENHGCGGVVAASALVACPVLSGAAVLLARRKKNG